MSKSDPSTIRLADPQTDASLLRAVELFQENAGLASPSLSVVGEDKVIDENLDEADTLDPNKINIASLVMASSFNDLPMPSGAANAFRSAIRNADRYADFSISDGGGRITEVNGILYDAQGNPIDGDDEDKDEALEQFKDALESHNETLSQHALDTMEWNVDPNTQMSFGGQTGNALSWFNAARTARQNLDKTARDNNWSEEKKRQQDDALAKYMAAIKQGDDAAARAAWNHMEPETKNAIQQNQERASLRTGNGPQATSPNQAAMSIVEDNSNVSARYDYDSRLNLTDNITKTHDDIIAEGNISAPRLSPTYNLAATNVIATNEVSAPQPEQLIQPSLQSQSMGMI